jgi:hypothetical protein
VPIHLLTREALAVYLRCLGPEGVLLFHISSRHLELADVLGALARDLGLSAVLRIHLPEPREEEQGILGSEWVLMARSPELLHPFTDVRWLPLNAPPGTPVWTDDFANVLAVYRWN